MKAKYKCVSDDRRRYITEQVIENKTTKVIERAKKKYKEVCDKAFPELVSPEVTAMAEKLPKGWIHTDNSVSVKSESGSDITMEFSKEVLLPQAARYSWDSIFKHDDMKKATWNRVWKAYQAKKDTVSQRDKLRAEIFNTLSQYRSFNIMYQEWPELEKIVPKSHFQINQTTAISKDLTKINALLNEFPDDPDKKVEEERKEQMRKDAKKQVANARK